MLILKPSKSRSMLPSKDFAPFTFITRMSFSARTLAYVLDSLVRVSRRVSKNRFGQITVVPQAFRTLLILWSKNFIWPTSRNDNSQLLLWHNIWDVVSFYSFLLNNFRSFHSLFRVLFIFPSQYLFAIGLPPIFSFGRNLPPILRLHYQAARLINKLLWINAILYRAITFYGTPFKEV